MDALLPDDHTLMDQARRGDATALASLYDRHGPRLLAIGQSVLRDPIAAQDVVHDVFIAAWRDAARYDPSRGSVRTWLSLRMRSRCLDQLRRRAVRDRPVDAIAHPSPLPGPDPDVLDVTRLRPLLDRLPPEQREAVALRYLDGLSSAEAAQAAGCPVGTLKSRLRTGLQALRVAMDAEGVA